MRVIFQADVTGVAKIGELKEVKDGYARNFLIPKGLAVEATSGREKELNDKKQREKKREQRQRLEMEELAARLKGQTITVKAKVGENNRLFGAVTNSQVAQALSDLGHTIDRKKISMDTIRLTGTYTAVLHLHAGVSTEIEVRVEKDD